MTTSHTSLWARHKKTFDILPFVALFIATALMLFTMDARSNDSFTTTFVLPLFFSTCIISFTYTYAHTLIKEKMNDFSVLFILTLLFVALAFFNVINPTIGKTANFIFIFTSSLLSVASSMFYVKEWRWGTHLR